MRGGVAVREVAARNVAVRKVAARGVAVREVAVEIEAGREGDGHDASVPSPASKLNVTCSGATSPRTSRGPVVSRDLRHHQRPSIACSRSTHPSR